VERLHPEPLVQRRPGISCLQSVDERIPCLLSMMRKAAMTALRSGAYLLASAQFFLFSYSAFSAGCERTIAEEPCGSVNSDTIAQPFYIRAVTTAAAPQTSRAADPKIVEVTVPP